MTPRCPRCGGYLYRETETVQDRPLRVAAGMFETHEAPAPEQRIDELVCLACSRHWGLDGQPLVPPAGIGSGGFHSSGGSHGRGKTV